MCSCNVISCACCCIYSVCVCVFGTHYRLSMPASFLSSLMSISIYLESKLHICCYGVFRNEFISFTNECMHPLLHVQCTIYTDWLALSYYRCYSCIWFFQYLKVILSRLMNIDGKSFHLPPPHPVSIFPFCFVDNFSSLWSLFMEWSEHCINV